MFVFFLSTPPPPALCFCFVFCLFVWFLFFSFFFPISFELFSFTVTHSVPQWFLKRGTSCPTVPPIRPVTLWESVCYQKLQSAKHIIDSERWTHMMLCIQRRKIPAMRNLHCISDFILLPNSPLFCANTTSPSSLFLETHSNLISNCSAQPRGFCVWLTFTICFYP